MTDFYFNFPDEATFDNLKGEYPLAFDEGGHGVSPGWSVDIIGVVYKSVSWDSEGNPTLEAQPGFLVNMRSDNQLPDNLSAYEVFPKTPIRVWA